MADELRAPDALRKRRSAARVRWALGRALPDAELIAVLRAALPDWDPGSAVGRSARVELGRRLVRDDPWEAARLARQVLGHGEDEGAHEVYALAMQVLGHHAAARRAYGHALALRPGCPSCLHNLGHLLDVVYDRPAAAVPMLERACAVAPGEPELWASLARALCRSGDPERARQVLERRAGVQSARAAELIAEWRGSNAGS